MVECVGLLSKLLQSDPIPLLVYLAIYLKVSAETPCVVVGDELVQQPFDKELECYSLDDVAEQNHDFTLADYRNIILLDRWCDLEIRSAGAINPEQVFASIFTTLVG